MSAGSAARTAAPPRGACRPRPRSRAPASDPLERPVRRGRKLDPDRVPGAYLAAGEHDAHHAGSAYHRAGVVAVDQGGHQPVLDAVELSARVAQPGHFDHCGVAQVQPGPGGQAEQVDPAGGDVLTHLTCGNGEALGGEVGVQLGVDQVHLAEVGLARVARHPAAVLDPGAGVRVVPDLFDVLPGRRGVDQPAVADVDPDVVQVAVVEDQVAGHEFVA